MAKRQQRTNKTNAMRELERSGVAYEAHEYDIGADVPAHDLGVLIADMLGMDVDSQFKTLVTVSPAGDHVVCCIPVAEELDLKKAAAAMGEKSLSMMHVRDLETTCGYARGACSPVGMRKQFPTVIDETAQLFETIGISGGRKGVCITLSPDDLIAHTKAVVADVVS